MTRAVVQGVQSDRITFIAASLAYYAFISLVPLLLLAIVVASVLGGPEFAAIAADRVADAVSPEVADVVRDALTTTSGRGGATFVGVAVLLWSGLKLFRGLDVAFSTVYGSQVDSLLDQFRDGLVTLAAVGLGVAVTVGVGVLVAYVGGRNLLPFPGVVGSVIMLAGLTVTLLPLYYVLPDDDLSVGEALPGALLAAVGWTALQWGFHIYAGRAGTYEAYGVLGAVLLLVTFLYFGGLILLLGVVLNAVLGGRIHPGADLDTGGPSRATAKRKQGKLSRMADIDRVDVADRIDVDEADEEELASEIERLQEELAEFEASVQDRTVHREEIEAELKSYVRDRVRRGKARGWGPYLVLLYGTAMTLAAFVYLSSGWAVLAMLVVWLSTLGLYALMLLVGAALGVAGLPGTVKDLTDRVR